MKLRRVILLSMITATLLSCSSEGKLDVSLKDVGFYIQNTPSDWWSSSSSVKPALTYFFNLQFEGNLSSSDILSAKVYLPGSTTDYWTLDPDYFNSSKNSLSQSGFRDSTGKELPIGTLKAVVELSDGTTKECDFTMGIPGNTTNNGKSYVYSYDDEASAMYPSSSVMALRRPSVSTSSVADSTIIVDFAINDSNVNNGCIYFFDENENYIGWTKYFRDSQTGAGLACLNSGEGFNHEDGNTNEIVLTNSQIFDSDGNAVTASDFLKISKCRICVIDGEQYESRGSYIFYDYKSYSAMTSL